MDLITPWLAPVRFAPEIFAEYRLRVIFDAFKWDPQVEDQDTIADFALSLKASEWLRVTELAVNLDRELRQAEQVMWTHPECFRQLGMPRQLTASLNKLCRNEPWPAGMYLRRYDFHFTSQGWKISEVNADVPGGFAESSIMPRIAIEAGAPGKPAGNLVASIVDHLKSSLPELPGNAVGLIHASSYADDRQVMACLESALRDAGIHAIPAAPDNVEWLGKKSAARSAWLDGERLAALLRFFPVEWLPELGRRSRWESLLGGHLVEPLLCSPGVAALAQSKRAPLIWKLLGLSMPTWEQLLPTTCDALHGKADWLLKPVFGRVGGGISGAGWCDPKTLKKVRRMARWNPKGWISQQRFSTLPVSCEGKDYYPCIGVFVLNGKCCGIYGRCSSHPLIDHKAMDVPVLISEIKSIPMEEH